MSLLKNLKTDDNIQSERDSLGGSSILESGLQTLTINLAFLTKSDGGALALNIRATTEDNKEVRQQFWVTSGDAKGNKNYYTNKNGEKQYLPGFTMANSLTLLTVGKEISELDTETRVISLWSSAAKAEVPTKVDMLVDLLKTQVIAGILKQTVDKTVKNQTSGQYEPTGETKDENEVDKFFRAKDKMTTGEIRSQATEASFIHAWEKKWAGVTKQKSKGASAGATSGAPKPAGQSTKPSTSLFG